MPEDLIESLWERGVAGRPLSRDEVARALRPRLRRGTRTLRRHLWGYLAVLAVTLVLGGMNVLGYWENPVMRGVQLVLLALALVLAWFGVRVLADARLVDRAEDPLLDAVRRRLAFFGARFEAWMWSAGLSVLLLSYAINALIDNQDGRYPINKPLVFVGTSLAVVLITYASLRLALDPVVRELRATAGDLEDQLLERTPAVDRWKRGLLRWRLALTALLALLAALGAWLAWRVTT